VTFRFKIR